MMVAAAFAFWRGWQIHHGRYAWMAYGLGVLALGAGGVALGAGSRDAPCDERIGDVTALPLATLV